MHVYSHVIKFKFKFRSSTYVKLRRTFVSEPTSTPYVHNRTVRCEHEVREKNKVIRGNVM